MKYRISIGRLLSIASRNMVSYKLMCWNLTSSRNTCGCWVKILGNMKSFGSNFLDD